MGEVLRVGLPQGCTRGGREGPRQVPHGKDRERGDCGLLRKDQRVADIGGVQGPEPGHLHREEQVDRGDRRKGFGGPDGSVPQTGLERTGAGGRRTQAVLVEERERVEVGTIELPDEGGDYEQEIP